MVQVFLGEAEPHNPLRLRLATDCLANEKFSLPSRISNVFYTNKTYDHILIPELILCTYKYIFSYNVKVQERKVKIM